MEARKVKGRKRHLLVDTEGLVLKAKVHVANMVHQGGSSHCSMVPRSCFSAPNSQLWLDAGYRGQEKGRGWALRRF